MLYSTRSIDPGMASETSRTAVDTSGEDDDSNTLVNAFIGAVAGIILSFIPLSTLLGGAIAGYLEGGDSRDGLKVGGYAGVIMLIPFIIIGLFMLTLFTGVGPGAQFIFFGFMIVFMLVLGAAYTIGLGMVGGYLGVYLKNEI